jgi:hypothetical protein
MRAVFLVFFNLCLLRRGPEIVPTQTWFVASIALLYALLGLYLSMRVGAAPTLLAAVTKLVVSMAAIASMTWFVLYLRQLEARFPATITALFGCDLVLVGLLAVLMQFTGATDSLATFSVTAVIWLWSVTVAGFVLHRAMNATWTAGMMLAVGINLFSTALGNVASSR